MTNDLKKSDSAIVATSQRTRGGDALGLLYEFEPQLDVESEQDMPLRAACAAWRRPPGDTRETWIAARVADHETEHDPVEQHLLAPGREMRPVEAGLASGQSNSAENGGKTTEFPKRRRT